MASEDLKDVFIDLWKEKPRLYDTSVKSYSNKNEKKKLLTIWQIKRVCRLKRLGKNTIAANAVQQTAVNTKWFWRKDNPSEVAAAEAGLLETECVQARLFVQYCEYIK